MSFSKGLDIACPMDFKCKFLANGLLNIGSGLYCCKPFFTWYIGEEDEMEGVAETKVWNCLQVEHFFCDLIREPTQKVH